MGMKFEFELEFEWSVAFELLEQKQVRSAWYQQLGNNCCRRGGDESNPAAVGYVDYYSSGQPVLMNNC